MLRAGFQVGNTYRNRLKGPHFPVYKYINRKDLHYWLDEKTVRVDTLVNFAGQEGQGGKYDPMETKFSDLNVGSVTPGDPHYDLVMENLKTIGFNDGSIYGVGLRDVTVRRLNTYIYCVTSEYSERMLRQWNDDEEARYDTVIKILDFPLFCALVQTADFYSNKHFESDAYIDFVKYAQFPLDLQSIRMYYHKFIKEQTAFGWQKEIRARWRINAKDKDNAPVVSIRVPELDKIIQVMDVPSAWKR
tara:strand:+ start:5634 stop:6371 length:738 start_codon:yes stop_codon:yes gene_type:complete